MLIKGQIDIIGLVAGACTTVSFLPQIIKILRTRHVRDISIIMYLILAAGTFLWLVYGIMIGGFPIMIANTVTLALCFVIIVSKIKYDGGK